MSDSYRRYRLLIIHPLLMIATALIVCVFLLIRKISPRVRDITHLWETKPIVSIYVPAKYQENLCSQGYQPVVINNNISSIGIGPCGCAQNFFGLHSSYHSCAYTEENLNICTSLSTLPQLTSLAWRQNTICIKRAGKAAASFKEVYKGRHHPNREGYCPSGYRKCGEGLNQQEGAICFPTAVECPITNLLMLPSSLAAPANQGWESAGEFSSANLTLYVRRQYMNELPVVDLVFQLTELNNESKSQRGHCYDHPQQVLNAPAVAIPSDGFSYAISLPKACHIVDPRYLLVDQVPLQDHFLQNLQLTEPSCEEFDLYPLSDPRYQPARDPDYLNSGVKCDFTSQYTCVRDPYQHTNCALGDDICDGVVNQNICGEYAHAVRSAFTSTSAPYDSITLGMYFAREVQWTDDCKVGKASFQQIGSSVSLSVYLWVLTGIYWIVWNVCQESEEASAVRFMWDYEGLIFALVLISAALVSFRQVTDLYKAVAEGNCTDSFTAHNLVSQLESVVPIWAQIATVSCIILLLAVESYTLAALTRRHSVVIRTDAYVHDASGLRHLRRYVLVPMDSTNPVEGAEEGLQVHEYDPLAQTAPATPAPVVAPATPAVAAPTIAAPPAVGAPVVLATLAEAELGWTEQHAGKNNKEYPHVDCV